MAWTEEREQRLRKLWAAGKTASQIAEDLGGVSREAVIGKVHRLRLKSNKSEPIDALKGASVPAVDLIQYRWLNGPRYLHPTCNRVLHAACALAAVRANTRTPSVTPHDLIDALVALARYPGSTPQIGRLGQYFANADITPQIDALDVVDRLAIPPHDKAVERSILGWGVVDILRSAAGIRSRTGYSEKPIDLRHVICGLMLTTAGQMGFSDAGLLTLGFERLQRLALSIITDPKTAPSSLAHPEWRHIEDEIQSKDLLSFATRPRADYVSDRVIAGHDTLGAKEDAQALANLILLEAAEPPLAIAVFGAWGSGKSTLLAELRQEIRQQCLEQRARIASGKGNIPGEPARISGVLQVDFNAWTFADSENLWASMTAELFDQIAAGGQDQHAAQHGARLVRQVAERTSHEGEVKRKAEAELRASNERIVAAEANLEHHRQKRTTGLVDASVQALLELFGPANSKAGVDKTSETNASTANDPALAPFRRAILSDNEINPDEKVRAYVEASGSFARFCLVAKDYLFRGASLRRWVITVVGTAASLALVAWLQGRLGKVELAWPQWIRWALPGLPIIAGAVSLLLPALRATAIFNRTITDTRERIWQGQIDAKVKLEQGLAARAAAERSLSEANNFLTRFADVADVTAASPTVMLDYLLKESAEVASVKGKMGFLSTVRRCFDQLNAIIDHAHNTDPNSPVQRIIIYIDDLDRCSEKQVVQVLEAIHLLLAYPCFVVIAAVDARWLEHALANQHQALLDERQTVTPADYLEKIFQIPFWVRPIDDGRGNFSGFRRLMSALLGPESVAKDEDLDDHFETAQAGEASAQRLRRIGPFLPEDHSTGIARRLVLTEPERDLLFAMGPIAAKSPRAVKRLVNLYRLIRVSVGRWEDQHALEGREPGTPSFGAVQLVLACEVGLPSQTMMALATAIKTATDEDWTAFATAAGENKPTSESVIVAALSSPEIVDRFASGVRAVLKVTGDIPTIGDLHLALVVVAKFSFRSSI